MCSICKDWKSGKIDSKKAYALITKELKKPSSDKRHLLGLSDVILDKDVPVRESNKEADEAWWKAFNQDQSE